MAVSLITVDKILGNAILEITLVHISRTDTVGEFAFEPFSVKWTPSSISVECDDRRLLRLHDLLQYEFANSISRTNVNKMEDFRNKPISADLLNPYET